MITLDNMIHMDIYKHQLNNTRNIQKTCEGQFLYPTFTPFGVLGVHTSNAHQNGAQGIICVLYHAEYGVYPV